jgi:hypothetical protein
MGYIGQTPSAVPLDGSDIADDIVDSQHYAAGSIDTAHLADDQITLAKMAAGTDGNIISYDASGNPVAIATGSDGQVLTSAGAGQPPAFEAAAAGGVVVQVVNFTTGTKATGTTVFILDNTIPQKTEGSEFMTLAITPTNASNKLLIEMQHTFAVTNAFENTAALFQDSTANALASMNQVRTETNSMDTTFWSHYMTAGTTSETTFKLRFGGNGAGTWTFNGQSDTARLGGSISSSMTIWEIAV